MKTTLRILLIFTSLTFTTTAQVIINYQGGYTPQQVVDTMFSGNYVSPNNVIWNGSPTAATMVQPNCETFTTVSGFPFDRGIYLSTAMGSLIADADLSMLATGPITNGAVLQFDFEALGDTLEVVYMFASSEYPYYVCSSFNDVFGFFISGPGISGPFSGNAQNIALIPNTNTPVAINTVNPGVAGGAGNPSYCAAQDPNWVSNSQYYTNYYAGYSGEFYNGGTIPLTAKIPLQCGEIYTIKFAVSNVTDQALNSGVYINKCQFPAVCSAEIDYQPPSNLNETIEGCQDGGSLIFRRVGCGGNEDQPLTTQLTFSGSAQNGVDYSGVPTTLTFAPYQTEIVVPLTITDDLILEGTEDVIITATTILPNGEPITSDITFPIVDREELLTNAQNVTANCYEDEATIEVVVDQGIAPYTYSWSNGSTNASVLVPLSDNPQTYTVETTDACGYSAVNTVTVERNIPLSVELTVPQTEFCSDQIVPFQATVSDQSATLIWYFGSNVSTGYPATLSSQDLLVESAFTSSSEVTVIATTGDVYCNDTSTVQVTIVTCGCTDPLSVNYNPLATLDDGSCVPNKPTVVAPNVFTPFDNHAENNYFFLNTTNAKNIELTIQNRWGNVIYSGQGSQNDPPMWNGKDASGKEMSAGTYFYTYKVEGFSENSEENILTGQGFVELIKK